MWGEFPAAMLEIDDETSSQLHWRFAPRKHRRARWSGGSWEAFHIVDDAGGRLATVKGL